MTSHALLPSCCQKLQFNTLLTVNPAKNILSGGGGFLVLLQLFSAAYSPLQYNLEAYSPLILRIRKLPRMARC